MKRLADIKRRMKPGVQLLCIENTYRPALNGTVRKVTVAGATCFRWRSRGDVADSLTHYEKASLVTIVDADSWSMELSGRQGHHVTLRFLPGAESGDAIR